MTILVIAEHDNAQLKSATLHTIAAAIPLNTTLHVLVAGSAAHTVAQQAARIPGVSKVLLADAPHLAQGLAENLSAQILSVAANYHYLFFAATASGKNVAPRVAATLDVAQISEIISVLSPDTFQRLIYAGNAIATVRSPDTIKVITVRTASFDPVSTQGGCATIEKIAVVPDTGMATLVNRSLTQNDHPDLTTANIVVAGGRALGSAENFKLLHQLADKLGAAVGASRAAVDAGYAPNDWQIGQTGKIVAPQLYIAVGISGAIQHLAGMQDAKVIVAINQDAEAPIFKIADYGLVGDLFQLVPELIHAL